MVREWNNNPKMKIWRRFICVLSLFRKNFYTFAGRMVNTADTALLSNSADITSFSFADETIRFRTSPRLERYTEVKEWDDGYMVVSAKYKGIGETEEYIDLVPILHNLYVNADRFLKRIKKVEIKYD